MVVQRKQHVRLPDPSPEETPSKQWGRGHSVFRDAGKPAKSPGGGKALTRKVPKFPAKPGMTSPQ